MCIKMGINYKIPIKFLLNYISKNWTFQNSSITTNNVWNSGYYVGSYKLYVYFKNVSRFSFITYTLQSRMLIQGIFSLEAGRVLVRSNLFFFKWEQKGEKYIHLFSYLTSQNSLLARGIKNFPLRL